MHCSNPVCEEEFEPDASYRYGVGFSHYTKDQAIGEYVRSYSQVFNTQHACSDACAKAVTQARIDAHTKIPFGTYDAAVHNPTNEQTHATCRANVAYNQEGMLPERALPAACAVSGVSLVGKDVYIPHVDKSYEGRSLNPTVERILGCASLKLAQQCAHSLVEGA